MNCPHCNAEKGLDCCFHRTRKIIELMRDENKIQVMHHFDDMTETIDFFEAKIKEKYLSTQKV